MPRCRVKIYSDIRLKLHHPRQSALALWGSASFLYSRRLASVCWLTPCPGRHSSGTFHCWMHVINVWDPQFFFSHLLSPALSLPWKSTTCFSQCLWCSCQLNWSEFENRIIHVRKLIYLKKEKRTCYFIQKCFKWMCHSIEFIMWKFFIICLPLWKISGMT